MVKKAFTLAELTIAIMIICFLCLIMIQTIKPERFSAKTNMASAMKVVEYFGQATVQIMDLEKEKCPARAFMLRPAGADDWEFAIMDGSSEADVEDVVNLYSEHLKFETDIINFCDYTEFCDNENIKGAKLAGQAYIGIEKFDSIEDCPAYYVPGEEAQIAAPTRFVNGAQVPVQCWGKLYIDANGEKGPDVEGQDIFVYGLGAEGIVK